MSDVAIRAEGLGKRYEIAHEREPLGRLTESLWRAMRSPIKRLHGRSRETREWIWALRDVSFVIGRGDVVGVIGSNGAGKSTLLKILSRITEPTTGEATLNGRVSSLLEVGTGFHPELTGRENVYMSGAVLGMRRAEITRKFDEIVAFAGVEPFLDTPAKRFSSGMQVRLGFAVAAHLEPEILIVDEVLAVGDAAFQKKSLGKMGEVAGEGRTVLFVSHNMRAVAGLCNRALLLDHGEIAFAGSTVETIDAYNRLWSEQADEGNGIFVFADDPASPAQLTRVSLLNPRGEPERRHDNLEAIDVQFDFTVRRAFPTLLLCCEVRSGDGTLVYQTVHSDWQNYAGPEKQDQFPIDPATYRATIHMPAPLLSPGMYELEIYLTTGPFRQDTRKGIALEITDRESFVSFVTRTPRGGVVAVPVRWDIEREGAG